MDIRSPIHMAHSDYGQQVYIAPPHSRLVLIDGLIMWRITGWIMLKINLLEQVLVMLKVASTSMEAQDAHEDILVIAQVCI
jgi:hypothetical protein